jgi:hypothetical protein
MPDDHPPSPVTTLQFVLPTKEQIEKRLAELERYAPGWKASPAYLFLKPDRGLIVSFQHFKHDELYFYLTFAVEEAIIAPEGFDPQIPITLTCVWNQPYLSLGAGCINAAYCFRLEFGAQGVQRIREFTATSLFDLAKRGPYPGMLSICFALDFELPQGAPGDETS